jgi:hypothetical protein
VIAKLAYLTTPSPNVFVLNIQPEGSDDLLRFEICKAHLANILISGTAVALREAFVPIQSTTEHSALGVRSPIHGEG